MKFNVSIWHSLGAVGCGSLVTYVGLKLLDGNVPTGRTDEDTLFGNDWYHDWDQRKPQRQGEPGHANVIQKQPVALRHIVLVRNGEYWQSSDGDHLTHLGRLQAHRTGQRLLEMGVTWDHVVASTCTRAQETAMIILKQINFDPLKMKRCVLLPEGTPYPSDPPLTCSIKELEHSYRRDGPRIEAAFRRYFFRASPDQQHDSYLLIIGHANVIRYFVCRALQLPPNAWTRFSLLHGSMTWLTIWPSGYVTLRSLGDAGFMCVNELTSRRRKACVN